jgi:hypothetical protein
VREWSYPVNSADRIIPSQGSEQDGSEFAVEWVEAPKHPVFRVQKNALGQVLGIRRRIAASSGEYGKRICIELAQLRQSRLPASRLTLRRPHDDRPAGGVKARRALHWRTMVAFHKKVSLLPTIVGESVFRNKILKPRNPKGLISIVTANSTLGGTAKPI